MEVARRDLDPRKFYGVTPIIVDFRGRMRGRWEMARKLRIQYPVAMCHVIKHGNYRGVFQGANGLVQNELEDSTDGWERYQAKLKGICGLAGGGAEDG